MLLQTGVNNTILTTIAIVGITYARDKYSVYKNNSPALFTFNLWSHNIINMSLSSFLIDFLMHSPVKNRELISSNGDRSSTQSIHHFSEDDNFDGKNEYFENVSNFNLTNF